MRPTLARRARARPSGDPGRLPWSGPRPSGRRRLAERAGQPAARGDRELAEHLAQMPLDRAGAEEQLGADLRVGEPVAGQARDLILLRGELVAHLRAARAD